MVDPISARGVDEGTAHGAGSASDFTKAAFEQVCCSDRLAVFFGEVILGQTFAENLGHAFDNSRLFEVPVMFPNFVAMDGLLS
jgi:hypothetical protein